MACYYPLQAVRLAGGGIKVGGVRPGERLGTADHDWLFVPCGSCVGCLKSRAREWAIRCSLELQYHREACWATLTYDDASLPPTLSKRHLQLFFKRLRARLPGARIRFFASGEYGERTFRPHYHPILYGTQDAKAVEACWPHGFAAVHELRPEAIAYVAGYVNKKLGPQEVAEERIDYRTGEVYQHQPAFRLMSRRPGIGGDSREFWRSWRKTAYHLGREVPVPRYLHERWKAHASWLEEVALKAEKRREAPPVDWERLEAGAAIAEAGLSLQSSRRTL